MMTQDITIVRVYLKESSHLVDKIKNHLKSELKLRGMTVFRAISGFGDTAYHSAALVDLSLDLPLVIEFFDHDKDRIERALDYLNMLVKPEHIVFWSAKTNFSPS